MRKHNSTNSINQDHLNSNCDISFTLSQIGGRWKINILCYLMNEQKLRFNELKKRLSGISERMLLLRLKELENDQLITKDVQLTTPPKVEYELTPRAHSLKEIFILMEQWGEQNKIT